MSLIGLELVYECSQCGNILKVQNPFWSKDFRKKTQEPKNCSCGNKSNFRLIDLKKCEYEVIPEGYKVVKDDIERVEL